MLDEKRIREAETNLKTYLAEGLVKKEAFQNIVFDTYLRNHRESLSLAEHVYSHSLSNLWTIVISYYSMFYIANAVLYKMGNKIGSKQAHKVTVDALIALARNKLKNALLEDYEQAQEDALEIASIKADTLLESLDHERKKRSLFQYETTEEIKQTKAQTSFLRAKEFSVEMEKLWSEMTEH